jgi:pimeloyl-ACP methyl ester carboxylesterase
MVRAMKVRAVPTPLSPVLANIYLHYVLDLWFETCFVKLCLKRVVTIGHSAGGHLGTWAAARHRLPEQSPLFSKKPLGIVGVVNLVGPADLESFLPIQNQVCGGPVVTNLIGGSPSEVPDRYRQASPSNLLPLVCLATSFARNSERLQ